MKRIYIPIDKLEIFDHMHQWRDGKLWVDEEKDGQSTEKHLEGIEYIKGIIQNGQKVLPILVRDNEDGTYTRLDGFKRAMAYYELGWKLIEAFVCSKEEYRGAVFVPFRNGEMRAWHGGQEKEQFGLLEEGEQPEFEYSNQTFLYNSPDPHGLKIEVSECIHVHWREFGRYRLTLGRKDFEELAKAIASIDG